MASVGDARTEHKSIVCCLVLVKRVKCDSCKNRHYESVLAPRLRLAIATITSHCRNMFRLPARGG